MIIQKEDDGMSPQNRILDHDLKVLLVDDNKVNQFLGKRILKNLGVNTIDVACTGAEALEKLNGNDYDVLLTDVEMPGMNGYELCRTIRHSGGKNKGITVIALTANASDEDKENALAAGIDDYLTKPYSPQDLLDVINRNIHSKKKLIIEDFSAEGVTGIEKLHAVFNYNEKDVLHFLKMLSKQIPELVEEIRAGIREGNNAKTFHAAHKLKSPVKLMMHKNFADGYCSFTEDLRIEENVQNAFARFPAIEADLESLLVLINTEVERLSK